ncbi:MAG: gliding motility lipoprotein GldH [Cyclobacteriaceae bacterium]
MRSFLAFIIISGFLLACDEERVFEKNSDFDSRFWLVNEQPEFEFEISDTRQRYNLYCNVRNSVSYPYARIFLTYYFEDSTGFQLEKKLVGKLLFDDKTGEPNGNSGLGDIYDHRIPLKINYQFQRSGVYKIRFEQFMRADTLSGILAVGLRVEKATPDP